MRLRFDMLACGDTFAVPEWSRNIFVKVGTTIAKNVAAPYKLTFRVKASQLVIVVKGVS